MLLWPVAYFTSRHRHDVVSADILVVPLDKNFQEDKLNYRRFPVSAGFKACRHTADTTITTKALLEFGSSFGQNTALSQI